MVFQPSAPQEEQAQSHVMSHVETVVHLASSPLVKEATQLQNLQVAGARHHHGHGQQDHGQTRLQVVVASLLKVPTKQCAAKERGQGGEGWGRNHVHLNV